MEFWIFSIRKHDIFSMLLSIIQHTANVCFLLNTEQRGKKTHHKEKSALLRDDVIERKSAGWGIKISGK